MNQVTVLGICTLMDDDRTFMVVGPSHIHVRDKKNPDSELKLVLVPMRELRGQIMDVRKKAHEMVDKALDEWEEFNLREAPKGTIKVWSEKEEKHL